MIRRDFVKHSLQALITASAGSAMLDALSTSTFSLDVPDNLSEDEFWAWIRECYTVSPNVINLNNGGVCPMPKTTQDALDKYIRWSNEAPSYYMWRILDAGREALRENLSYLAGCSPEEIAINRNSTEGLNTVIFGLDLKRGDEVVLNRYDYPNMINAWKQREKRDGIKLNWIEEMNFPMENDEEIVQLYLDKMTPATRIVHITHVINWTGQVLPVKKIAEAVRQRGAEVIVDGAHSFGQIDFSITDLSCDYFATSLHKWLCAPFGSGLMYVRKEKIPKVWALLSANEPDGGDIRKFESLGTRSFASEMAIGHSLNLHQLIGTGRKAERLQYLKKLWSTPLKDHPLVYFYNSFHPQYGCALANIHIKDRDASELEKFLWEKYKIHTVAIHWEKINGVRITPNVYTSEFEMEKLSNAILQFLNV
ncbi:MAG TPA: aminotransferase class V-fold PLP-dependent enzyme [Saprospiraceae bacterium]|nr:aminotransferase class V-fold PLP-dependent enzyme [Saprospiraceae bacterium]